MHAFTLLRPLPRGRAGALGKGLMSSGVIGRAVWMVVEEDEGVDGMGGGPEVGAEIPDVVGLERE